MLLLAPAYCVSVNSAIPSRSLAIVGALAVALSGLLPTPHAHLDRPDVIVHTHVVADAEGLHHADDADHDRATLDHGDHATARTVVYSYDIATRFVLTIGTVAVAASAEVPASTGIRQPNRTTLLPTHDPPIRFTSSTAPPALV